MTRRAHSEGLFSAEETAANTFLTADDWPAHNARFAHPPAAAEDFHRRCPSPRALDRVFRLETPRTIGQDGVSRGRFPP